MIWSENDDNRAAAYASSLHHRKWETIESRKADEALEKGHDYELVFRLEQANTNASRALLEERFANGEIDGYSY
jgi:hypothetical protein